MKGRPAPQRHIIIDGKPLHDALDESLIRTVVDGFYERIRNDDLLGPVFNSAIPNDEWPRHLNRMYDFWSATLLRTNRYDGNPLAPHLQIPGLGEAHFHRWLSLFRLTVDQSCRSEIADLFLDRAVRIAHSFRLAIAFHNGENTLSICPITKENLATGVNQPGDQ